MIEFKSVEFFVGGILVDVNVDVEGIMGIIIKVNVLYKNVILIVVVFNMYFVVLIIDCFVLGGGLNVNYGLKLEYGEDYVVGVYGGKIELMVLNFNLSGVYDLGYGFSVGVGLNVIYLDVEI